MEEIPELPTSKLVNCWAAANHGLAVEVEKRAVRETLLDCANTTEVPWFSKDFGQWLGNILNSKQMTGQLCADFLLEQKPPHCFLTAWRHLYDTAKLGVMNGIINDLDHAQLRNWKSLAKNVPMLWPGLITEWNLRLSHSGKGAANNRYKYFMERFILADYSPDRLSSQEAASRAGLPLELCDKVWAFVKAELEKSGKHTPRPVHLYSMVQALAVRECIPPKRLGVITRILGERYGVTVRKGYRPDKPRGKNWQYGTVDQDLATAATYHILARIYPTNKTD